MLDNILILRVMEGSSFSPFVGDLAVGKISGNDTAAKGPEMLVGSALAQEFMKEFNRFGSAVMGG